MVLKLFYIAAVIFVCLFVAAVATILLRPRLPGHHLSDASKDTVKLGMGLLATIAALLLSLLIASTKASFDTQTDEVERIAASVGQLDRFLTEYGPEAGEMRNTLHRTVARLIDTWLSGTSSSAALEDKQTETAVWAIHTGIHDLQPQTERQRELRNLALQATVDIIRTRWLLITQQGSSIRVPFLVVLVFWLTMLFASFGLFAPANPSWRRYWSAHRVGRRRDLLDTGARSTIRRADADFQRAASASTQSCHHSLTRITGPSIRDDRSFRR